MIFKRGSKLIAAILTAALVLSPVFTTPSIAFEGQDVETCADSWRYSEGEIICEEDVAEETEAEDIEAESTEPEASSIEADSVDAKAEVGAEAIEGSELSEEDIANMTEEELEDYNAQMGSSEAEQPEEQTEEQPAEEVAGEPEPDVMTAAGEGEELSDVTEEVVGAKSATAKNKYWKIGGSKRYGYLKGIDVSYWQHSIDWGKVKSSGIDFAIIRCGYGSNTKSKDDSTFVKNAKACEAKGIPYGVYLYSYANTVAEAKDEANHALRLLSANNLHPEYPVYYDLEDREVSKASNETIRKMATAFCNKLTLEGYRAGVYASLNWWNSKLKGFGTYDKWVAQWNKKCDYSGASIWQCSSSGSVAGISGRVDANLTMKPKASMDSFMSGAYKQLASYVTGVSSKNYDAYVSASSATAKVAAKKGPGRGYYSASSFPDGTKVHVSKGVNGYLEVKDTEGSLGKAWIKSGSVVKGSTPKDFVKEEVEGVTKKVLHSYDGNIVASQWATVRGKVYYVDADGVALTGRQTIGGKEYYLGTNGVAVSNKKVTIDGKEYYLGKKGLITKNCFVKISGYIYGFDRNGTIIKGKKVRLGYETYTLDKQGRAYINRSKTKKKAKYYAKAGSGKKGTIKKGKRFYVLRTSGKWSQMANGYWVKTSLTKKIAVYPTIKPSVTVKYKAKLKKKTVSRSGPSGKYIKKKTFKKNKTVTVIGTYGSWSKVSSGQWLPSSRLRK